MALTYHKVQTGRESITMPENNSNSELEAKAVCEMNPIAGRVLFWRALSWRTWPLDERTEIC